MEVSCKSSIPLSRHTIFLTLCVLCIAEFFLKGGFSWVNLPGKPPKYVNYLLQRRWWTVSGVDHFPLLGMTAASGGERGMRVNLRVWRSKNGQNGLGQSRVDS